MFKKALIILLTINIISLIQSCCSDEFQYKCIDFSIDVINNSGAEPVIIENNEVNKNALGFKITSLDTVMLFTQNFKLMNECYATSCEVKYTRVHNLSSIKIITLMEYSNLYNIDCDITELFMARESENTNSPYISIDQIISKFNESTYEFHENNNFDLYLIDTTAFVGMHRFEVQLTMSDGTILTQMTDTLKLF